MLTALRILVPTILLVVVPDVLRSAELTLPRKVKDMVIYRDDVFYSAFPSIVKRPNGELIVAFRRAPERRVLGEPSTSHTDPNSYLVLVRSQDAGLSWSSPEHLFAHPFGGSQDPCLLQLNDGTLLCSSYGWALLNNRNTNPPSLRHGNFVFLGGYVLRSADAGRSWQGPFLPPVIAGETSIDPFGKVARAYNRGAMCEGKDGRIFWAAAANNSLNPRLTATHLLISTNEGSSWTVSCAIAKDDKVTFNETSLYQTPTGDLVAFMRTANFDDHTVVARSRDGGKSFDKWEDAGFQGHPHYALRLSDNRVLLVYGYRHTPFGIRARVLDSECRNLASAPELILRDDGGSTDVGYPWAVMVDPKRVLVVYYFNIGNGTRHIAGTLLSLD